jgi:WD40 repeat protein
MQPEVDPNRVAERRPLVPDHELLRRIGKGSYGEVWLARNVMGAYRAVKIIYRNRFESERPYQREFEGIRRFEPISRSHPSQLSILHIGCGADFFYYVMELADDQARGQEIDPQNYFPKTLRNELNVRGRVGFEQCVEMSLNLATALDHLHRNGLVHRDVKPSNIVFVHGIPKLADIGLVAEIDATISIVGTEGYLPPEGPGAPQADIYSFGKVLYEMATGHDRQDFPELPTDLRALGDSQRLMELNEVIIRACSPEKGKRYQSAADLRADLELLHTGKSLTRLRSIERRLLYFKRWAWAVAGFAVLASGAFFYEARQSRLIHRLSDEKARMLEEKAKLAYASQINLAQAALRENNLGRALEILDRQRPHPGDPDLRGWEWRYLWGECRNDALCTLSATGMIVGMATSADGKWLAAIEREGSMAVWDLATRQRVAQFDTPVRWETAPVFSPVASVVAFAAPSRDKSPAHEVVLWNAETRQIVAVFPQGGFVQGLAFAANGETLVVLTLQGNRADGAITVWRIKDRAALKIIPTPPKEAHAVGGTLANDLAVAADGSFAVYATRDSLVHVVDLATGTERWSAVAAEDRVLGFALSGDDKILATGAGWAESDIRLWDVATGKETGKLKGHSGFVGALAFLPGNDLLLSGSGDQTIRLWDVPARRVKRVLRGHRSEIWSVALIPNQSLIASGGKDGTIRLWDLADESLTPGEIRLPGTNTCWWCAADSSRLITADDSRRLLEWRAPNFNRSKILGQLAPEDGAPLVSPDGSQFATGSSNGIVRIRSVESFRVLSEFAAGTGEVSLAAYAQQGKRLWIWDRAAEVLRAFDSVTGKAASDLPRLEVNGFVASPFDADNFLAVDWSKDGRWFVSVSAAGHGRRVDLQSGTVTDCDLGMGGVSDVAISPDANLFAVASTRGLIRVFETGSFQEVFTVRSLLLGVTSVMFSPDRRSLAAGNPGGGYALKIWDIQSRQELVSLPGDGSDFRCTMFSDDNRLLGTLNSKGKLFLWRAPSWEEINRAEKNERETDAR